MKRYRYQVIFHTGEVEIVHAGSTITAEILAQAEQIKKGNDYLIKMTTKLE